MNVILIAVISLGAIALVSAERCCLKQIAVDVVIRVVAVLPMPV